MKKQILNDDSKQLTLPLAGREKKTQPKCGVSVLADGGKESLVCIVRVISKKIRCSFFRQMTFCI